MTSSGRRRRSPSYVGPASSADQSADWNETAAFVFVGKAIPRIDGPSKVTGAARFAADIALPGLLHGRVVRSQVAHARIVRIDVSRALAFPGVAAAIHGGEARGVRVGKTIKNRPVLCWDIVRFVGDPVAAVAATTAAIADDAAHLVDVAYEALPAVTDPYDAM